MSDYNEERLGKIVALAKRGTGGEKENALRIVKMMCRKHDLNFDDVMGDGEKLAVYSLLYKRGEKQLALHVIEKYGRFDEDHDIYHYRWGAQHKNRFYFETSVEKYIECMNAWSVLNPLMKKEIAKVRRSVFFGFLEKHDLFSKPSPGDKPSKKKLTAEEWEARRLGAMLAGNMEDAQIRKQLSGLKLK